MIKVTSAVLTFLFLLLGAALPAVSDTVYILPEITDSAGSAAVDDCVTTAGGGRGPFEIPAGAEKLEFSEISYLSRGYIEDNLAPYAVRPVVFVGEGTLYQPKRYSLSRHRETIRSIAEKALDRVGEPYDRVEIIFDDSLSEVEEKIDSIKAVQGPAVSPRIESDFRGNGRMTAHFSLGVNETGRKETEIKVKVRGYILQAWTRRSLEAGQSITAAEVTVKEIPASDKGYGAITTHEILSGYAASRRLAEGEKLTRYNTRKRIDVKAGEEITVTASSGTIEMKLAATARESGRVGEVIGVKPRNGEKSIKARIVSPGEAVIEDL